MPSRWAVAPEIGALPDAGGPAVWEVPRRAPNVDGHAPGDLPADRRRVAAALHHRFMWR